MAKNKIQEDEIDQKIHDKIIRRENEIEALKKILKSLERPNKSED